MHHGWGSWARSLLTPVSRAFPRAGGGGSSTATTGYGRYIRTGAQGTCRFGVATQHNYKNMHCNHCLSEASWQRGVYEPLANGGIVAVELSTGGVWRHTAFATGTEFKQRGAPVSLGPLLQSIPWPWGVMEYRNGIGVTTPARYNGGTCKTRSSRSRATVHPTEARLSRA